MHVHTYGDMYWKIDLKSKYMNINYLQSYRKNKFFFVPIFNFSFFLFKTNEFIWTLLVYHLFVHLTLEFLVWFSLSHMKHEYKKYNVSTLTEKRLTVTPYISTHLRGSVHAYTTHPSLFYTLTFKTGAGFADDFSFCFSKLVDPRF